MKTFTLRLLGSDRPPITLTSGKVHTVGRDPSCDLVLPDTPATSKKHAQIEVRNDRLLISGIGVGGISVNGKRAVAQTSVRAGDHLQIGSAFVLVGVVEGAAPPPPPPQAQAAAAPLAAPPPPKAAPAPEVPGYVLGTEVAALGASRLFQARERRGGREVLVRFLDAEAAKDAVSAERFSREGKALQRLDHPNIVRVREVGESKGLHYHVNEHFPGAVTLAVRLRAGPLGPRMALQVGIQVANALALAHEAGVVHRDVSPGAILVTRTGIAKLHSFAFVKTVNERGHTITEIGEVVGDLVYSSPEQCADPRKVDARSDLYSLGATLFHAIAGRPPFAGKTHVEQVRLLMTGTPPKLEELVPETPPAVAAAVSKLLARNPDERFASAKEAAAALQAALLEVAQPAPEPAPAPEAKAAPAPAVPGSVAGGFSGLELLDIVHFLELRRREGTLAVTAPPVTGEIRFKEGEIVGADAGALEGEAAVLELLAQTAGTFAFTPGSVQAGAQRWKPTVLALTALRIFDEGS
jgi:hypothetical protein